MSRLKLNVGVIGVGYWGKKIVEEYSRIDGVNIDGVSDLDEGTLRFCAEQYGIKAGYTEYERLLARTTLDAVSVCAPNAQHYPMARAALEAGKHVLVEKPLTLDSEQARELLHLAAQKCLKLSVGHIFRFNNALAELRRLIRQGNFFGKLFLVEMNWVNLEPAFPGRDVIWDQGPHIFDIQNYLMDAWPIELNCTASAFRRKTGAETAYIVSRYREGTMAMSAVSWLVPCKTRRIFIAGEARSAAVDAVRQTLTIYEPGCTREIPTLPNNTIHDELVYFVKSIVEPDGYPESIASVGVKAVELIEAAQKSIAEGRAIKLEDAVAQPRSAGV